MESILSDQIQNMDKYYRMNLINSLAGYKSLNLLGTISNDGNTNLCIISSVFHLGANPPLLGMVIRPERPHNDTLSNIKFTGQYTLNNILPNWYMQAHQTSASYSSGVSEFDQCGFDKQFIDGFKAPFVGQSTVRAGLELRQVLEVNINGTTIVIGEIKHIVTDNSLISQDGTVDHIKAETMTATGLDTYYLPQLLGRLAYAKPGEEAHAFIATLPSL